MYRLFLSLICLYLFQILCIPPHRGLYPPFRIHRSRWTWPSWRCQGFPSASYVPFRPGSDSRNLLGIPVCPSSFPESFDSCGNRGASPLRPPLDEEGSHYGQLEGRPFGQAGSADGALEVFGNGVCLLWGLGSRRDDRSHAASSLVFTQRRIKMKIKWDKWYIIRYKWDINETMFMFEWGLMPRIHGISCNFLWEVNFS